MITVVVTGVLLTACASEQPHPTTEKADPTTPSSQPAPVPQADPPATPMVVTFDGFGPIRTGVTTVDDVLAMPGWTEGHDQVYADERCAMNTTLGAEVTFTNGSPDLVSSVRTPKGTLTDRGVGNESSLEQIRSAYAGTGVNVSDPVTGTSGTAVTLTSGEGRQIVFDFLPTHGPVVEGSSGESRCLPGPPTG